MAKYLQADLESRAVEAALGVRCAIEQTPSGDSAMGDPDRCMDAVTAAAPAQMRDNGLDPHDAVHWNALILKLAPMWCGAERTILKLIRRLPPDLSPNGDRLTVGMRIMAVRNIDVGWTIGMCREGYVKAVSASAVMIDMIGGPMLSLTDEDAERWYEMFAPSPPLEPGERVRFSLRGGDRPDMDANRLADIAKHDGKAGVVLKTIGDEFVVELWTGIIMKGVAQNHFERR